jgi:hypothetical protein
MLFATPLFAMLLTLGFGLLLVRNAQRRELADPTAPAPAAEPEPVIATSERT